MRALAISAFGEQPQLMGLPIPAPGPDDLLVRIHAAGVNPFDLKVADGMLKDVPHRFPMILGSDGAGVVEAVGAGVSRYRVGDQVYGQFMRMAEGLGSYAEYALVSQTGVVARMPRGMIFTQAAAVPTSTMTAYNMAETAKLDRGQIVLVNGATGGVGQQAVQFAANAGATVIATATPDMAEVVRAFGAEEIIDYTTGPVPEQVLALHPDGIDAILDTVSPDPAALAVLAQTVRPGGTVVTTTFTADPQGMAKREIVGVNLSNKGSSDLLTLLADLIDAGDIRVRLDAEVPLEEAPAALDRVRAGLARGKTVLEL
ncbi:NADP-dependent oxidoreductase [Nonomuraea sp. NBC_01738]|uniref:NADP-dependent oxidoreductase n=1 Tax=Nonomuraea sp. NBC_01738 TaxID=2976003 RepID=UPI002E0E33EB|nr:NADP-dependent oxidoreductase [Nonomuraea sp. NBC_01738]